MMTAYANSFTVCESIHLGSAGYLPKPFNIDDLFVQIRRINSNSNNEMQSL